MGMSLKKLQQSFKLGVLEGKPSAELLDEIVAQGVSAALRFDVYRNNTFASLMDVLSNIYKAVPVLVGEDYFKQTLRQFIQARPPKNGCLFLYGDEYPEFLKTCLGMEKYPFVADVAEFEWLHDQRGFIADDPVLEVAQLAELDASQHENLQFDLHDTVQLFSSKYPVLKLWEICLKDPDKAADIDMQQGGDWLLITRNGNEIFCDSLTEAAYIFLQSLAEKQTLGQALEAAYKLDSSFDVQKTLVHFFEKGVFKGFKVGRP